VGACLVHVRAMEGMIPQYKVSCARLPVVVYHKTRLQLDLTYKSAPSSPRSTNPYTEVPTLQRSLHTVDTCLSSDNNPHSLPTYLHKKKQAMADPIHRVLFTTPQVHIYAIPPLTSTRGFNAGPWTAPPKPTAQKIFTARLRVLETSSPDPNPSQTHRDLLTVTTNLEDPTTGELFAASPYVSEAVVQPALDSSRFFAVRVVGEGGMKATLGIGFEDRSDAFDFGIALSEARKVLGWEKKKAEGFAGGEKSDVFRDFSLKEGEKIHIQVGGKGRGKESGSASGSIATGEREDGQAALFSIAPPPSGAAFPSIAPPPPSSNSLEGKTAQELGFDDGEFGEFQ
jgi:hypothetical protein